ncbi:MAG: hypothetical protein Q7S57_04430 [bacterium]|nr:hypothetical protein [bacterium]
MFFIPFEKKFQEIAGKETRGIIISQDGLDIPRGTYFFLESYCDDRDCDCRKVMISVIDVKNPKRGPLATIGFGWENAEFYVKWIYDDDLGNELTGSYLDGLQQTELSVSFLKLWKELVQDRAYVERIKKHYEIWKGQ